jgi:hypothetical protein
VRIPVGDNCLGERKTHAREAGQLSCGSGVGIETLTRPERPGLPHGAVPVRAGRAGGQQREKLDLAGRLAGSGNQIPDALTKNRKRNEEENRPSFGGRHGEMIRGKEKTRVGNSARTA